MALSERDKQVLAQMEAQLASSDPDFASRMRSEEKFSAPGLKPRTSTSNLMMGIVALLAGICLLVGGVALSSLSSVMMIVGPAVGVLGFLLMVWAVTKMFSIGSKNTRNTPGLSKTKNASKGDFMRRQEERWERRREQN